MSRPDDELTGLANLKTAMATAEMWRNESSFQGAEVGCIAVDLDHFKEFNNALGHVVGDVVLIQIAVRISNAFQNGEIISISADVFYIFIPDVRSENQIEEMVAFLYRLLDAPIEIPDLTLPYERDSYPYDLNPVIDEHTVRVRVNIGYAVTKRGDAPGDCLFRAEESLNEAKLSERNQE